MGTSHGTGMGGSAMKCWVGPTRPRRACGHDWIEVTERNRRVNPNDLRWKFGRLGPMLAARKGKAGSGQQCRRTSYLDQEGRRGKRLIVLHATLRTWHA